MGKVGRIACIFTPYVLTVASLICLIFVGIGCTASNSSTKTNLYFFRINTENITTSSKTTQEIQTILEDTHLENEISVQQVQNFVDAVKKDVNLKDFYDIGLWGYCDGSIKNGDEFDSTFCSKPKAEFYFNPLDVWDIDTEAMRDELPSAYNKGMKVYKAVSKWMFIAYIIAFIATCLELILAGFAICSRWGSCVVFLFSTAACLFTVAASATSTALFVILKGVVEGNLKAYGVTGNLGTNIYAATWLAAAFAIAANIFWLFSVCCCSGRSPYHHKNRGNRIMAEKAPHHYEPVGPQGHHSYEPYRT
ncbi:hypothetical protein N7510_011553 [Penicillium lagena]|uniref:uncharacterized protein n=1 Tax=Penicillium lagena TaxID=94218 RepID=UPI002540F6EE|nr:uncharacterized protein N7510_011553 [Penicillium lagena]KAJ5602019.1 hypothetical protein N7510_011553 [Penicillium lagena]